MASFSIRLVSRCGYLFTGLARVQNGSLEVPRLPFATTSHICRYSTEVRAIETTNSEKQTSDTQTDGPSKETLLRIDWLLDHQLPFLLKSRIKPFFDACEDDVVLEDRLYKVNLKNKMDLLTHITKMRMYFRYMSPFNKIESIGSCVYEGEDVVVILWKLSTMESSFFGYLPWFMTKKKQKIVETEGAIDVHLNKKGYIYKIVNRKLTAADLEGAKVMKMLKDEAEKERKKVEQKEMRRQSDEEWHKQKAQEN